MTAAQEIGWDVEPLVPAKNKANASRKSCPITQYADNYRLTKKKNPFSRDVFLYRDMPPIDPNAAAAQKKNWAKIQSYTYLL